MNGATSYIICFFSTHYPSADGLKRIRNCCNVELINYLPQRLKVTKLHEVCYTENACSSYKTDSSM